MLIPWGVYIYIFISIHHVHLDHFQCFKDGLDPTMDSSWYRCMVCGLLRLGMAQAAIQPAWGSMEAW